VHHCLRHYEEPIAALCKMCQRPFCTRCLIYPFGPKKPPYCVGCALAEAGVRESARGAVMTPEAEVVPAVDKKALKLARKAEKTAAKDLAKATKAAARSGQELPPPPGVLGEERDSRVPVPGQLRLKGHEGPMNTRAV
jgi:hypothetical protein